MLAIIGGTGLDPLSTLAVAHREVVRTPYGEPSAPLLFGQIADRDAVFLARHGHGHTIPPHRVNYRANLWALQGRAAPRRCSRSPRSAASAARRRATSCCRTSSSTTPRVATHTFFDGGDQQVVHVDFTHPYSTGAARRVPGAAARAAASRCGDGGVYGGGVNGPRLETAAEIDRMERDGATLVGMTGMPEAVARARARSCRMRRCAWSSTTPPAAATAPTQISMEGIARVLETAMDKVRALLDHVVPLIDRKDTP